VLFNDALKPLSYDIMPDVLK